MTDRPDPKSLAEQCARTMWASDRASHSLDMRLEDIDEGRAVMSMAVKDYMLNGYAMCHGGYIFALADDAFAYATNSQDQAAVAASCSIDFLLPAYEGEVLTATAQVLHQSARSGLYDVTVTNGKDEVIARFRGRSSRINQPILSRGDE